MALMTMAVLAIISGTAIAYSTASEHSAQLSLSRSDAYRLAESGINNALAVLGNPSNNALDPTVFCGISGLTYVTACNPAAIKTTYSTGYVVWAGTLNQATGIWSLSATGYARNTNVNATTAYSTRTLTVSATITPTLTQPLNTPVWNYIYATKPPSAGCDEDLFNSVTIASPFYVEGNLCLHQTTAITKGPLVVKGKMSMDSQNQNYAGTASVPLSDAHIVNGCTVKNTTHTPCKNGGVDNLFATVLDTTPPANLAPPTPDYNNWYLNANPGPYFPCQTINGQAPLSPLTFDTAVDANPSDTDAQKLTYQNNSVPAQNLTPSYDYRCQTDAGELSWNNTTKTLTIKGTVYIDGSVYVMNGATNLYTGQGVIYLGGTLFIKGANLCGAVYNNACDLRTYQTSPAQGWNPNATLVCFVAKGTGGQVNTADSIQLTSASFQGAAYAAGNVELDTTSNIDGPIVGYQVLLGQSVTTSFPSITIVPNGMPSNPTVFAQLNPPGNYSG